jgi:hypothetical protein
MAKVKGPEKVANMVKVLRAWQGIERKGISDTAEILEQTNNPLIRMIMEIIRHDSLMHHRIQQFLIDGLTEKGITVSREELGFIWEKIEAHDKAERKTIELAQQLREDAWDPIHRQLIDYLLTDEEKHDTLLGNLGAIKTGMDKASGG